MKRQDREKEEARAELRQLCPPGTVVTTVLRHVARSGMYRCIDVYLFSCNQDGTVRKRR